MMYPLGVVIFMVDLDSTVGWRMRYTGRVARRWRRFHGWTQLKESFLAASISVIGGISVPFRRLSSARGSRRGASRAGRRGQRAPG